MTINTPTHVIENANFTTTAALTGLSVELVPTSRKALKFTLTDVELTTTDDTDGAFGSVDLGDFGNTLADIVATNVDITMVAGSGGITDTAQFEVGVGSTAIAAAATSLGATEDNVAPDIDVTMSGGSATPKLAQKLSSPLAQDGTTTATSLHLNVAAKADAHSTADDTITVNGIITVYYDDFGDD